MPSSDVRAPPTSLLTRTTTIDSLDTLRTDANAWALDPAHLDDTLGDLAPLAACPELDTLLLFNCRSVVDLAALAALGALHTLRLDNCSGVADLSPLGGLQQLREVGLHRCTAVDPASEALEELLTRPGLVVSR